MAWYQGGVSLLFRHASGRARAYLVCQPEAAEAIRGHGAAEAFLATCAAAYPHGAFACARAGPVAFSRVATSIPIGLPAKASSSSAMPPER